MNELKSKKHIIMLQLSMFISKNKFFLYFIFPCVIIFWINSYASIVETMPQTDYQILYEVTKAELNALNERIAADIDTKNILANTYTQLEKDYISLEHRMNIQTTIIRGQMEDIEKLKNENGWLQFGNQWRNWAIGFLFLQIVFIIIRNNSQ